MRFIGQLIRFSRLHTIVGTSLSITALYVIALSFSESFQFQWPVYLLTLLSCLGANVYITGLNQLTDLEIDRINKPYLPLASGEWSVQRGYWVISISVAIALVGAIIGGKYLISTVGLSLLLGTAYSVPPIRLKRFHFWAAFCILSVRGLIVNLLLFLHFHYQLNQSEEVPPVIWLLTATIFLYSILIAWFKDIPDMQGDDTYGIRTLSLRIGPKSVLWLGSGILTALYVGLMGAPWLLELGVHAMSFSLFHLAMLGIYWLRYQRLDMSQPTSIAAFYQFLWLLFFAEYVGFAVLQLSFSM